MYLFLDLAYGQKLILTVKLDVSWQIPEFSNVLGTISATQDTELSMGFILYGSEMAKATCSNPVTVTTKNYLKH